MYIFMFVVVVVVVVAISSQKFYLLYCEVSCPVYYTSSTVPG